MTRSDYLVAIMELMDEIPDLLVSTAFLSERLRQPLKFSDSGQEIMNLVEISIKTEKWDIKRIKRLYSVYWALYMRISQELGRLCSISETNPHVPISPRLNRWWTRYKRNMWEFDYG